MAFCEKIKQKGYKVFIQPMVTIMYSDYELLKMLEEVNEIEPYAFYIVDSFGVMKKNDLSRLFFLIDNNLNKNIHIGYHSHNNLQLSFSNAQYLCDIHTNRNLIIDSSVFGMGRGAGNLNTELLIDYYNSNIANKYDIYPVLDIIDKQLRRIHSEKYWGYSLPYYLSALNNCHPNFATYLADKNTLTANSMNTILRNIKDEKKCNYDEKYIRKLYIEYQNKQLECREQKVNIIEELKNKKILLLAPGRSLINDRKRINEYIDENSPIIISINFKTRMYEIDYMFWNNEKRYVDFINNYRNNECKIILTSNLKENHLEDKKVYIIDYNKYTNKEDKIYDNAVLMFMNFLIDSGFKEVAIAGFDGYSVNEADSYIDPNMAYGCSGDDLLLRNQLIRNKVKELKEKINMKFITNTVYSNIFDSVRLL